MIWPIAKNMLKLFSLKQQQSIKNYINNTNKKSKTIKWWINIRTIKWKKKKKKNHKMNI